MRGLRRVAAWALLLPVAWSTAALASEPLVPEPPAVSVPRPIPDLHLSVSEVPGETTLRLPLGSEGYRLYGLLSPYLSLGSSTTLVVPGSAALAPAPRSDTDRLDDVRLGAGMALPLSSRAQLYGEYRFLRGRLDSGLGRGLLQREPDSADFRAGFSIRLD
jgi:hypothetical protein